MRAHDHCLLPPPPLGNTAMEHAEPNKEINTPQQNEIEAGDSAEDRLPQRDTTDRPEDTMIGEESGDVVDDKMVDSPEVAAGNDVSDRNDDVCSGKDRIGGDNELSSVADTAERANISTTATQPMPMEDDGDGESCEQEATAGAIEGAPVPTGQSSRPGDISSTNDDAHADDDGDSQPVIGTVGSEASPMDSADGMESSNHDSNKDDESSVLSASDVGKSETASETDADKDEVMSSTSERAALEDAYGPYIHPTDMCLDDARKRLRIAIEQTRVLREVFTDQAYERFRVVMRPAPSSIEDIVDPIEEDPEAAVANQRETSQARKVEKDKEMRQSQQTGIALEELAYIGDGLDLVVLPDDEVSDSEIDVEQYPENGPTDPETNQRREGINSASQVAVEQLFERIKRGRLIREGKDIETVMAMARTVERTMSESFHPTTFARTQTPSPAPSEDSNAAGFGQPRVSRGLYSHLLTLNPEVEGDRPNGGLTAARSALITRGVGMSETKRDLRINPVYQRVFQPNYLLPPSKDKLLPPLVGPQQISRLQAPSLLSLQKEPSTDSTLQTTVTNFCDELGSSSGMSEISLMKRVRATFSEEKEGDSTVYEPSLLYSVMSALGLIRSRDNATGSDAQSLGLDGIAGLKTVSDFLNASTGGGKKRPRPLDQTSMDLSDKDSPKKSKLEIKQVKSPLQIRGGGGGDEETEKQSVETSDLDKNNKHTAVKKSDVPQAGAAAPLLQYPLDANYKLYSAMAQNNSQSAMAAAAASSQILQHQLGLGLQTGPYTAAMTGSVPVASTLGAMSASELSDFYMRNGFGFTGASLAPAPDAATAARYQAALAMNPQNPFGYHALSHLNGPIVNSNKGQKVKKVSAQQRKRASSFSQNQPDKRMKSQTAEEGEAIHISRPASAPPSPISAEMSSKLQNTPSDEDSIDANVILPFTPPDPPKNMPKKISNLALRGRCYDAMTHASEISAEMEASLVDFLLSLGASVTKLKSRITGMLLDKLSSSDKRTHIGILAGDDKFASNAKEMIVALISMWICVEQTSVVNSMLSVENGSKVEYPELEWLVTSAIGESLKAIAPFLNPLSSANPGDQMKQVVLVVGKSLTKEVCLSVQQNASLPVIDDLMELLDSLRSDALQAKTRERVLLASLVSRSSNMTEEFSNAYVSSIIRAGEALTHEDVCEIVQDTDVRASTMLPFDYFQDNAGVWEEPCRPERGYHSGLCGVEMKKEAHARSLLRKSMKRLQDQLGLKGGILDGGPYYPVATTVTSAPTTPTGPGSLMRSFSGSMKQKGSSEHAPPDAAFNPGHFVPPMNWNIHDVSNLPYGNYSLESVQYSSVGDVLSYDKEQEYSPPNDDSSITLAQQYRSTHEVKWKDVADVFLHGGNSRQIDINSVLSADEHTGKKKIYAPFVHPFDISSLKTTVQDHNDDDSDEEEDISDETILKNHQEVLDEMKLKLDAALEKRRQQSQGRGRKKSVG